MNKIFCANCERPLLESELLLCSCCKPTSCDGYSMKDLIQRYEQIVMAIGMLSESEKISPAIAQRLYELEQESQELEAIIERGNQDGKETHS